MNTRIVKCAVVAAVAVAGWSASTVLSAAQAPTAQVTDRNCSDFPNQAEAQRYFISRGGPASDPDGLDADHNGIACESLPCPCSKSPGGGDKQPGKKKPARGVRCGTERWPVKTLSERAANRVNFHPKSTTVAALTQLPAPDLGKMTPRIAGVETTTYKVKARLVEMKREDDRDIHLVIAEPSNPSQTMIVELPDVACKGAASSAKKAEMRRARSTFTAACGHASGTFARLAGTATITGVGFFDLPHGQKGIAPNGIELHPLLKFRASTCERI